MFNLDTSPSMTRPANVSPMNCELPKLLASFRIVPFAPHLACPLMKKSRIRRERCRPPPPPSSSCSDSNSFLCDPKICSLVIPTRKCPEEDPSPDADVMLEESQLEASATPKRRDPHPSSASPIRGGRQQHGQAYRHSALRSSMKFLQLLFLASSVTCADALALYNPSEANALSQKSVLRNSLGMSTTRREPIRMPSQTPMVPYKVSLP
jgi:hypothetical protein